MFYEEEQLNLFGHDTWSGKMSPEPSAPTKEKTSQRSLKKQSKLPTRKLPMCLYLKKDGPQADASWETAGALLGEFSMHSFGESPKDGVESHLSQILEVNPHQRYCLSAKACQGILTRASRRGKQLPEMLRVALEQMIEREDGKSPTLRAEMHGNIPAVMEPSVVVEPVVYNGENITSPLNKTNPQPGYPCHTLGTDSRNYLIYAIDGDKIGKAECFAMQGFDDYKESDVGSSLKARDYKDATDLVVAGVDCRNMNEYPEPYPTLQAKPNGGQSLNFSGAVRVRYIVRRLTPLECERLQGFPDGWTDIPEWVDSKGKRRKMSGSARYKALGNSIALPPWKWVLKRLCACYERDATMASLFDGIGGFPYIWEQLNGKGSCLWSSEIEEFPMAVTKLRFGGNDNENNA